MAARDNHKSGNFIASARMAIAVTPDNSTEFNDVCRALYIGVGGDAVILLADGSAQTFKNLQSGQVLPVQARRVNSTNTTATNILALY